MSFVQHRQHARVVCIATTRADVRGLLVPTHEAHAYPFAGLRWGRASHGRGGTARGFYALRVVAASVSIPRPHVEVMLLVHSTWRHRYNLQELRLLLGDTLGPRVVAAAPDGDDRWLSIQAWVEEQAQSLDLLILDDAPGEFPTTMPYTLVVCDPSIGISDPRVQQSVQGWLCSEQERRRSDDDAE